MAENLKIGDIVELNSGGPKMTIVAILPSRNFQCAWFLKDGDVRDAAFSPEPLKKLS